MPERLRRLADLPPVALAAWLLGLLVTVWAARLTYPYDLEWMEGGMLGHAWRLQRGLELYPEPGPEFIPYVYPPGFASLVALAGSVGGLSFGIGRAVALLGVFSAAGAILWGVWRQTGSRLASALAAVVFLGAYPASGAFYDLVRPDGMYVALLAWAIVVGMESRRGAEVAAGLLLAAAFVMKHNAAAFGVPILVGIFARDGWRTAVRFGLAAAVPAGLFTVFMQLVSEGRFLIYLIDVPSSHPMIWSRVMPGLPREVGTALPLATALPALWFLLQLRRWSPGLHPLVAVSLPVVCGVALAWGGTSLWPFTDDGFPVPSSLAFWAVGSSATVAVLAVLGGGIDRLRGVGPGLSWRWVYGVGVMIVGLGVASLMRAHNGGYLNVYMHLHWLVAFAFGIALARVRFAALPWAPVAASLVAAAQLGWQIGSLDRAALTPTEADREAGDLFVRAIEVYDGPVLSPFASWMPVQAGKDPSLHLIALWDLNYEGGPYFDEVGRIREALRERWWAAAIDGTRPFGYGLLQHYEVAKSIPVEGTALQPKTGWLVRPARILEPKESASGSASAAP